ncbi:hypothetical protein TNCV_2778661 [Trichonephila clavipes]|nr:hypothetical protein TNCV_2778661 [Trichonephila clavipes]
MGLYLAGHKFEPSTAEDPPYRRIRCKLNMSRLKYPPVGGVWKLKEVGCQLKPYPRLLAMAQNYEIINKAYKLCKWAQNNAVVFHKLILFSDEVHFWLNGYVNKQNCRIWSEANPQVYFETPLHPEKLTVWCALWAGGIIGTSSKTMKATTLQSIVIGIEP